MVLNRVHEKSSQKGNAVLLSMTQQDQRSLQAYGKILRRVLEVEGALKPSQIKEVLRVYRDVAICDPRLFHFQIAARNIDEGIELSGEVSLRELKTGLVALLQQSGIRSVQDKIVVLPGPSMQGRTLALVSLPIVSLHRDPTLKSEQTSQLLIGDAVEILKRNRDYSLVQGPDGYIGWTNSKGIRSCDPEFFQKWISLTRAAFLEPIEQGEITIPIGAELPLLERGKVLLPDDREFQVREKSYRPLRWLKQPQRQAVVKMAKRFLGVPYLWGGKSIQGIDCSGLVQVAYRAAGIYVSRDANQQFLAGRLVATRSYRGDIVPGDLLFFCSVVGNISHTAISLGDHKYIHACDGGVVINSLDPGDEDYNEARAQSFAYAKRLIQ